jgi:hypothetical protein
MARAVKSGRSGQSPYRVARARALPLWAGSHHLRAVVKPWRAGIMTREEVQSDEAGRYPQARWRPAAAHPGS